MNQPAEISAGEALSLTFRLMRSNAAPAAAAVAVLTGIGIAIDLAGEAATALTLVSSLLSVLFQYRVSSAALRAFGHQGHSGSRFWGVFLLSLLYTLGIFMGLVLLVIPGIYLAVRWSLSLPILLEENVSAGDALGRSMQRTRQHFWPILLTLAPFFAAALGFFAILAFGGEDGSVGPVASAVSNLLLYCGTVGSWHAAVALYALLAPRPDLSEVFA
jgi:hypothetical protein